MNEQTIQKKIIKHLESIGAYVIKIVVAQRSGIPDLICCYRGKFIAFEVKSKTGKVSALQSYNIQKIKEQDGHAFVVRSVEEVKDIIKQLEAI